MDYLKVGELISNLRKEKGLTQKELADKLGITDRAVSKWERGLGCPDVSLLDGLSKILDVSISEILKGKRLEKHEVISNDSIIESMNYSKESIKNKMKRYFNLTSIAIIIIIGLILSLSTLKSMYYLHKTYYYFPGEESNKYLFTEVQNNIDIVKNNQGIYSDDDYKKILVFVDKLGSKLNKERDLNYYSKANYTYPEIAEFYQTFCNDKVYDIDFKFNDRAYTIIHKYDSSVVENMISYSSKVNSLLQNNISLYAELKKPYYNDEKITADIVATIHSVLYIEYLKDNMMLKDIIKVGEMNE